MSATGEGRLTTHVLDTANGCPAAGMGLFLFRLEADTRIKLVSARTNSDGRCDAPLLAGEALKSGVYELVFYVGDYFQSKNNIVAEFPFLGDVPVRFGILDIKAHYHVPLLVSPYGYSTYRGS